MAFAMESATLQFTADELRSVQSVVPKELLETPGTFNLLTSVKAVTANLSTSSIFHFACHGKQDFANPLDSALFLNDGQLKLSQIMAQQIPRASLVFLSACQTAMGEEHLPDEVIHIAATLMFAGFRGAVATMW